MPDMILPPAGATGIYAMLQTSRQQGQAEALAAYRSAARCASPESDLGFAWFCFPSGSIRAQKTASGFHAGPECLYLPATETTDRAGHVMRWVIALFIALLSIPIAQVAADAWNDRPGPRLSVRPHAGGGPDLAVTRHLHHMRLYDPIAPWLPAPGRAKTG
jgi:hypothetical protein